jgi:hypothetical protein
VERERRRDDGPILADDFVLVTGAVDVDWLICS